MVTALDLQAQIFAQTGQDAHAVQYLTFTVRYADYSGMNADERAELLKSLKAKLTEEAYSAAVHQGAEYQLDDIIHELFTIQSA
jgi:dGTP triphosphohydrolase